MLILEIAAGIGLAYVIGIALLALAVHKGW
jgi:hypothetical protein